jgi:hypothetical protein
VPAKVRSCKLFEQYMLRRVFDDKKCRVYLNSVSRTTVTICRKIG